MTQTLNDQVAQSLGFAPSASSDTGLTPLRKVAEEVVRKGDSPGHPFRGNQYTNGGQTHTLKEGHTFVSSGRGDGGYIIGPGNKGDVTPVPESKQSESARAQEALQRSVGRWGSIENHVAVGKGTSDVYDGGTKTGTEPIIRIGTMTHPDSNMVSTHNLSMDAARELHRQLGDALGITTSVRKSTLTEQVAGALFKGRVLTNHSLKERQ